MRETQVWSLGWEDPLEKEMAAHSSTLAWKIQWMEEPRRLQSVGSQRVRHNWATLLSLSWTMISMRTRTFSLFCFQLCPQGLALGGLSINPIYLLKNKLKQKDRILWNSNNGREERGVNLKTPTEMKSPLYLILLCFKWRHMWTLCVWDTFIF